MGQRLIEKCKALLVAADAHTLQVAGDLLRSLGIQFKRNTTGQDAVAKLLQMEAKPDFILLDLDLHAVNAIQLARDMKTYPELAGIPIIGMAAESYLPSVEEHRDMRLLFTGFLIKPLPYNEFHSILTRVLDGECVWRVPS